MKKIFEIVVQAAMVAITIVAIAYAMGFAIDVWVQEDTQRCVSTMEQLGKDTKPCY